MTLDVLPNIERIAIQYLLTVSEVTGIVGQRVVGVIPDDPTFPLLRVSTPGLGGVPIQRRLGEMGLDFHAYAATKSVARNLAAVAQAAMWDAIGAGPYGVVSSVRDITNIFELQDPTYGNKVTRYLFTQTVRAHPL